MRLSFSQITTKLDNYLATAAEYVDLTGLRSSHDHQSSLEIRIPAPPNDYSVAGIQSIGSEEVP